MIFFSPIITLSLPHILYTKMPANHSKKLLFSLFVGLAAITFAVFSPALQNQFTNWDDETYVSNNFLITQLNTNNLQKIFTTPVSSNNHPLTILSLALNYQVSGQQPKAYILTNIALHIANTLLVFFIIYILTKRKLWAALIVCILFGIHPMHVESVAWISERKDVLYTSFLLLGLLSYLYYRKEGRLWKMAVCFLLFTCSLLSKSAAVVFPLLLLLIDYWQDRQFDKKAWLEKVPFLILALIFGIIAILTQSEKAIGNLDTWAWWQRLLFASYGLLMYVVKLVAPVQLSAFYPYPEMGKSLPIVFYLSPIVVTILGVLVWYSTKKTKSICFGVLFFLISIFLVLQWLPVGDAIMADRYTYVPYIGLFFIIGYWFERLLQKEQIHFAWITAAALLFWTGWLGYTTFERTKIWKNSEILWTDVITKHPDRIALAHNNRGNFYRNQGEISKALQDYNKALKINPLYYRAYGNRSNIHLNNGNYEAALNDVNKVLELSPNDVNAISNRGIIFSRQQDYDKALQEYNRALQLQPNHTNTLGSRAALLNSLGKHQEAIPDFNRFLAARPSNHLMHNLRGSTYHQLKQYSKAVDSYNKAIQLQSNKGNYYLNRSYSLTGLGQNQKALDDALKARKLGVTVSEEYLKNLRQ